MSQVPVPLWTLPARMWGHRDILYYGWQLTVDIRARKVAEPSTHEDQQNPPGWGLVEKDRGWWVLNEIFLSLPPITPLGSMRPCQTYATRSDGKKTQSWSVNVFGDFFFFLKEKRYSALFLDKQSEGLSWCNLKSHLGFLFINSLFSIKCMIHKTNSLLSGKFCSADCNLQWLSPLPGCNLKFSNSFGLKIPQPLISTRNALTQ